MAEAKKAPALPRRSSAAYLVDVRQLNCSTDDSASERRCVRCKQVHLRPGYCQALDPINADKYPEFHVTDNQKMPIVHRAETATLTTVASDFNDLCVDTTLSDERKCDVCGSAYQPKRSTSRFCSPTCRSKSHRSV